MTKITDNIKKIVIVAGLICFSAQVYATDTDKVITPTAVKPQSQNQTDVKYMSITSPLLLVNNPAQYLNKNVEFTAKFNKFTTLGLDYPPVERASQVYTGVLIERDDVTTHVIPLSELKMFIKIAQLKQCTDLASGDKIKVKGKVISTALGDPWLDIDELTIIEHVKSDSAEK